MLVLYVMNNDLLIVLIIVLIIYSHAYYLFTYIIIHSWCLVGYPTVWFDGARVIHAVLPLLH